MEFIAYTVKGLENIAAQEIIELDSAAKILNISTKKVIFSSVAFPTTFLNLKTVDDINFLVLNVKLLRDSTVVDLSKKICSFDFAAIKSKILEFRNFDKNKFSLTVATFKTKFKAEELKTLLAADIAHATNWEYEPQNHQNFDMRVFCEKKDVYVSVRLTSKSLYFREYKTVSVEGALRPTIAAAMVSLIGPPATGANKLVDNFCGSGTILAEAYLKGFEVYGSDISFDAVSAAKTNLKNLDAITDAPHIKIQDAAKTKWQCADFDACVSNLPWDSQIKVDSITNLYVNTLKEYKRILKPNAHMVFLVHKPDLFVKHLKKTFSLSSKQIKQIKIGYLGQNPTIVYSSLGTSSANPVSV